MKHVLVAAAMIAGALSGGAADARSQTTIWLGPNLAITEAARMIDRGKLSEGMQRTRRAMAQKDLHPNDQAAAYNNLCVGHIGLKLYQNAVDFCGRALRLRPGMWQAHNNRGNAYLGMADYDSAIQDYRRAMKLRPDLELIEFNLYLALNAKQRGFPAQQIEREG